MCADVHLFLQNKKTIAGCVVRIEQKEKENF